MDALDLLYIDLFCGAGGTSTGVESARYGEKKCAKVVACVNHDANAIASHAANHPEALHFTEDIRTLELTPLVNHLNKKRSEYPNALVVLWASLECTNFSKAKGGQPRDADSRTLAEHLFRYIEALSPDYIQIENVEEFMCWGDMDENGKPISKDKGKCYIRWRNKVCRYGYDFDFRVLNAADYGAYTSRKRFFGIFAKKGFPIVFPEQTHAKITAPKECDNQYNLFDSNNLKPWKAVREVLDFSDKGETIFRKKPLVEKTLSRIYAGLIKFVAGGKDAFLVKWNSWSRNGTYNAPGTDEPCPVVSTQNRLGVAQVSFLSKAYSGDPMSKNISVEGPAGTVTCKDHHVFLTAYYGNGGNYGANGPAPTLTTKDRLGLVTTFIANSYSGGGQLNSINEPNPAVTTTPKQNLVSCSRFLMNPQFNSAGGDIEKPCFTLIARMDKMPPYLVEAETNGNILPFIRQTKEGLIYEIYDTDSEMTKKIKEFMAIYGIVNITMRMLRIPELKRIMGFPENYILVGSQADQKKFIGNAVEVTMARVLCEGLVKKLKEVRNKKQIA